MPSIDHLSEEEEAEFQKFTLRQKIIVLSPIILFVVALLVVCALII